MEFWVDLLTQFKISVDTIHIEERIFKSMKTPDISILIANYNNGHFFKDCFDSLIAQTQENWEAIVIDDCSTDDSVTVIKKMIQSDSRFTLYQNKENMGYQKTLLKAIDLATAAIFGRLDPDDALMPKAVELSVKTHHEFPEVGLAYSNRILCDADLQPFYEDFTTQVSNRNGLDDEINHFATFKREIYDKTSGISSFNKRAEDKDIYLKMCEVSPVKHIDELLYKYRMHKQGAASVGINIDKAYFWHWVALIKAAERRNINIEDMFVESFAGMGQLQLLRKSRWLKLGKKLGFLKNIEL